MVTIASRREPARPRRTRGTGARSPGRRDRRKQATRRQLIRAGRGLFSEAGLYEARIEDLAKRAGIGKGTLYLYFRNRDELAREVVAMGYGELRAHVRERIGGARSLAALLRALVEAHVGFFQANPDLVRIFHQARGMLKFHRREWSGLRAPLRAHLDFLAEALRRVPSGLRRRPAARRALAVHLFGAVSGVVSVRTAVESRGAVRGDARALARGLTCLAAAGLRRRPRRVPGSSSA